MRWKNDPMMIKSFFRQRVHQLHRHRKPLDWNFFKFEVKIINLTNFIRRQKNSELRKVLKFEWFWLAHSFFTYLIEWFITNLLKKSCGCKASQTEKDGCNKKSNQCKSSCKSRIESYGFANAVTKVGKARVTISRVIQHSVTQSRQATLHHKVECCHSWSLRCYRSRDANRAAVSHVRSPKSYCDLIESLSYQHSNFFRFHPTKMAVQSKLPQKPSTRIIRLLSQVIWRRYQHHCSTTTCSLQAPTFTADRWAQT